MTPSSTSAPGPLSPRTFDFRPSTFEAATAAPPLLLLRHHLLHDPLPRLQPRMAAAVEEVDQQADDQPDEQPRPRFRCRGGTSGTAPSEPPSGAVNQTQGVLNGRWRLGSRIRRIEYADGDDDEREQRADRHQLARHRATGRRPAGIATARPVMTVVMYGVRKRGWICPDDRRQQSIARHAVEHAGLPEQHHQDHRGETGDGAELDERARSQPRPARRRPTAIGSGTSSWCRGRRRWRWPRPRCRAPCRSSSDRDDADRHVPLRVLRFLRGGATPRRTRCRRRRRFRRRAPRPLKPKCSRTPGVGRDERVPVGGMDVARPPAAMNRITTASLTRTIHVVDRGRFLDADTSSTVTSRR